MRGESSTEDLRVIARTVKARLRTQNENNTPDNEQLQQIDLPLSPFHFFSIQGIDIKKTYSSRLIFHLTFPFLLSQSPIISLQSPIERGDIASPFPYRKGENQSAGALLPYMLKLRKRISPYSEKRERRRSIYWSSLTTHWSCLLALCDGSCPAKDKEQAVGFQSSCRPEHVGCHRYPGPQRRSIS